MKIHKIQGDISSEIASSFKGSIAIDTEATGLLIPERDKLSLVQICGEDSEVYIVQPDRTNYKMPNLASVLENNKIQKIGHFLRFDKSALEYFLKQKLNWAFYNLFGLVEQYKHPHHHYKFELNLICLVLELTNLSLLYQ